MTRRLPDPVQERILNHFNALLNEDDTIFTPDDLTRAAQDCAGLLITPTEKMTREAIDSLPETIRIISTFSVGYDHIDVDAASARNIAVTNTPDVLTDATADIAMLLLLGAARGASWGEKMVRSANWGAWSPTHPLGFEVTGKRLGVLGMGRIGQAVAKRARAFSMEVHYHNRSRLPADMEHGARYHETVDGLLEVCDFLSINCASTAETRGLLNADAIAPMPDGAIVVNTARGDIVDDDALIAALTSGKLAAAGLDVFRGEPDIDPRYRTLENTFLLPHLGSATIETRIAMGMRAVDNLEAFFKGETPGDLLNPQ
ncbi:MAG: 2-hydroxyacid dehydrogenase [Hyphomicrobiales bacterium]